MNNLDVRHYRFLDRAIQIQLRVIDRLRESDGIADSVHGSDATFPFVERTFRISSPTMTEKIRNAEKELQRLIDLKKEIENIAEEIQDPTAKKIFRGLMDGKSQSQIAKETHHVQSTISRWVKRILEAYCDD